MERYLIFVISFALGVFLGYSAKANDQLPPPEYDHPFNGTLKVERVPLARIYSHCAAMYYESGMGPPS